jgi:lipopolysaccharide export system protein LptA
MIRRKNNRFFKWHNASRDLKNGIVGAPLVGALPCQGAHKGRPYNAWRIIRLLLIGITFALRPSFALETDSQQRATLAADHVIYNSQKGIGTYTGNVIVIQGSTKLYADRLITHMDTTRKIDHAIALGNPAHFETLPKPEEKVFYASAKKIEYYPQQGYALLIGEGYVIQDKNSLKAEQIKYDFKRGIVETFPQTMITLQPQ